MPLPVFSLNSTRAYSRWASALLALLLVFVWFSVEAAAPDVYQDGDTPDSDVVHSLTSDTFDSFVNGREALVAFYTPYCVHCQGLRQQLQQVANDVKQLRTQVFVARVDVSAEVELGERFGISSHPSIKWFSGRNHNDYLGGTDAGSLVKFAANQVNPAFVKVADVASLNARMEAHDVLLVGCFADLANERHRVLKEASQKHYDVVVVHAYTPEACRFLDMDEGSMSIVRPSVKPDRRHKVVRYKGELSVPAVQYFVAAEKLPEVVHFSQTTSTAIFSSSISNHVFLLATAADLEPTAVIATEFRKASEVLKKRGFICVTVDIHAQDSLQLQRILEHAGSKPTVFATVSQPLFRSKRLEGPIESAAVIDFAQKMSSGSLQQAARSQPIPANPVEDDVTVVVGKSFDEIVKDPARDVLLLVYVPWQLQQTAAMQTVFQKLARRFREVQSIVVAQMDGVANEHHDVVGHAFPTVLFFPAAEAAPSVVYNGEVSLKAMTKFVKENARIPYELKKKGQDANKGSAK